MKVAALLPLIAIFSLLLFAHTTKAERYYAYEEYIKAYPEEKIRDNLFKRIVEGNTPRQFDKAFTPKIAIVYPGGQVSDYWRRSILSFRNRLQHYGVAPTILKFAIKPSDPMGKQTSAFREAIQTSPDYLIFTLNVMRHQRLVESVIMSGHPKIILQNITTPLKDWEDKQPFMYVGFDHAGGSKMLAEYYNRKTGGKGKYAVLLPGTEYLNEERGRSFISYMDTHTSLKLVSLFQTGINKEKARRAARDIARKYPDIKFIYACSTDIALGAVAGLREAGMLGKIMINGWGGGSPEIEAIQKGELDVTLMRINDDSGVAMADAVILDLLGKKSQIPLVFSGRFEILEKGVSQERLQQLQNTSFRYSGKQKDN
ncbi:substrate-binding domain-containing protein [Maridesulfovibrio sp.]|uniref:substrate-binding domain-containing protein n=1 Tax=Maridesulfovibrio sp. TaxID=2795000 RepID=UPI0029C9D2A0|nr:substrate-binding domain-containing protein [Maridesulfovibrio sp.]